MTKARILIVEDEQIVAMDIQNILESNGFIVAGQTDRGEDAILKTMELKPDLILMDISLKGKLDGIESAIQIRAQFDLPVIFLTAYGNPTIIERARLAAPSGYIFKPFEERELISNIEMALYKHEMDRKVRESEIKFRSVVEQATDGIALVDNLGTIVEWNPAMANITGLQGSDALGMPIWEITFRLTPQEERTTQTRDLHAAMWEAAISGVYPDVDQNTERVIETPQGERRIVQSNGFAIQTSQGAMAGVIMRDITRRKKAEDEVVKSEKRFRALIEHGRDNISLLSADGGLIWESPSVIHTLGYEQNQFIGRNIFELMHADDLEWTREVFRRVMQKPGNSEEGIFRLRRSDGSWRWIEATATNLLHEPIVQAIIINYRDVTERKRAEEVLLVKDAAIASSINAIAMSDLHGRLNYVNGAFLKMWGFDEASEVLGKPVTAFWVDKEQAGGVAQTLFDKGNWVGEMTASRRDNSRFEAQVSAHLVKGTDGQPICMMSSFLDITERKKAENELRKLSQAVEQSANAVVITDINGNIEYANPKFVEVSGYPLSEAVGKTPRILNSGEHAPEFYQNLWQTIKAGRVWRGEIRNRRKDGTLYWEDSTITPVFDSDHKLVNFIAIKEDITARKALEEAERSHRRLAEALRDTSAALNSTLKLDEVLDRVLENIEKVTTFDAAMVLMLEGYSVQKMRQLNKLQNILSEGLTGTTPANLVNIPILKTVRETQQPCLILDTRTDQRWRAIPGMSWIRSFICAPVVIRGQVAGVINILSATPGVFTPSHAERLMVFAGQAAVAIENAQLFEQAYYLSVTDPLTELTNRRHFFEVARFEFERTHRYPRMLSVMVIDIDHFKNINDTHGHAVGDVALREVAARIKRSVRTVDIVARYGGEEFIVLMPETGLQEASQVAERVRGSVANSPIVEDVASVTATLSIGVAEMDENSKNIDQLIVYADKALYEAKAAGRNRVASYRND